MHEEPLFGDKPVHTTDAVVESVCVKHFSESATRPPIWEGFRVVHDRMRAAQTKGEVWIGGEFVVDCEDPRFAQVHLRIPDIALVTDSVQDVMEWLATSKEVDHLSCDTSAIAMVPSDHPHHGLIQECDEFYLDQFTADRRKGFPILDEPPAP